jgi:DNA-binding response OmpR family regulator
MRVLLIEPDAILAATYQEALQYKGHIVDEAATAQQALIAADEHCPDIVILELQLSGANGIGFLQEFRSYSDWRSVPVIVHSYMSPLKQPEVQQLLATEYAVARWLYKPRTTLNELCALVSQYGGHKTEDKA